jgi:hypothetical protein
MGERIRHEDGSEDAWVCICGNTPSGDGFYPIDQNDHEVEPTAKDWTTNQYFCGRCGRVINQATLEVERRLVPDTIVRL